MRLAVFGRLFDDSHIENIKHLFEVFKQYHVEVHVFKPFYAHLVEKIGLPTHTFCFDRSEELSQGKFDFVFSIGGDGTILETATFLGNNPTPILGLNTGRLGFLSSISCDEIDMALRALHEGNYIEEARTLLTLESEEGVFGKENFALNEVVVSKKDISSMITIRSTLDGAFLNSYWADGLIISTSTGSTAYSLSCGGPIIMPGSGNFLINPIAPHNLNVRPIVVPDDSIIELEVVGRSDGYNVSLDSRMVSMNTGTKLIIRKSGFKIKIVRLSGHSFLQTIREKLHWGIDERN